MLPYAGKVSTAHISLTNVAPIHHEKYEVKTHLKIQKCKTIKRSKTLNSTNEVIQACVTSSQPRSRTSEQQEEMRP